MDGKEVAIRSPKDAFDLGIGMIHQHFKLVDVLTAAENIVLGLPEPGSGWTSKGGRRRSRPSATNTASRWTRIKKIYDMSVSEKQTVEIVKVLYRGADILILDEPTAVLTPAGDRQALRGAAQHAAATARPSSSSPTSSTRCWSCPTGWRCCARASTSATVDTKDATAP